MFKFPDPTPPFETVCHRRITGDPVYFPQAAYHGQIVYFCTEACLHTFQDDPERFIEVHGKENE